MAERETIAAPRGAANAQERLLQKMYISNVAKRLRELNQPTDNDRKRWIWELIQNAKDTIANDPNRTTVNINIRVDGDTVQFVHDGNPFTLDARFGLLWKYSEDKENQESTGRFGTGFLTTHCLSKIVDIQSDVYGDNNDVNGFEVTMFRDGQTEAELLEGLNKMKDSERWYKQPFGKTTYTYHVKTDSGRRAIQLGIENFKENIAQTMLFCNELASVTLNYNGEITTIKRQVKEELGNGIYRTSFVLNNGGSHSRTFIYTSYSEHNDELSKKYKAERSIRINAAIEVDDDKNIISHRGKTSFFCSLPLVGIEEQLDEPLIINSPDFELDSERQSLILSGETHLGESGLITENGINHLIYERIMPLYDKIVSYLSENGYNKLYELACVLKSAKNHPKLDKNWYEENVINKYRAILGKYPVATSFRDGTRIKLSDAIFIKAPKEEEISAFSLLRALYPDKLVKENHEWSELLWKEGLNVWGTKELCEDIEAKENWNNISLTDGTAVGDWYNRFLKHVSEYDDKLLKEHALLPNLNGKLLSRDAEGFRQGENLDNATIALIATMGKDIRPYILHTSITAVTLEHKYNSTAYSSDMNALAKGIIQSTNRDRDRLNGLLPLLSVIVTDSEKYSDEYASMRKAYFNIMNSLFCNDTKTYTTNNTLLKSAWEAADEWFAKYVLSTLQNYVSLDKLPEGLDVNWLNGTLKALQVKTEMFNTYKVIPNQKGIFCKQETLYKDGNIPQELKADILTKIGVDYKDILLDPNMDASVFAISKEKTSSDVAQSLCKNFGRVAYRTITYIDDAYYAYSKQALYDVACYIVSLLPNDSDAELKAKQERLLETAKFFLGKEKIPAENYIDYAESDLWRDSNKFVAIQIMDCIQAASDLTQLNAQTGDTGEVNLIEKMNRFFKFINSESIRDYGRKLYPNQNGKFCSLEDLKRDEGNIGDALKNIIAKLVPENEEYRNILMDSRMNLQPQQSIGETNAFKLIDDTVKAKYDQPRNWADAQFKDAAQSLLEVWSDESKGRFNEANFPKIYPIKADIMLNVVWTKDRRQKMADVSKLDDNLVNALLANPAEFKDMSESISSLKNENARLRERIKQLESGGSQSEVKVTFEDEQFAGLSNEQKAEALKEAREAVLEHLSRQGYDISNAYEDYCEIDGVMKDGIEYPLVVRSYKRKGRKFVLNAVDCEQLKKNHAMLWVYDGTPRCVPFDRMVLDNKRINVSFSIENLHDKGKLDDLSVVLRWFKGLQFDFSYLVTPESSMIEEFNSPEKRLTENLKAGSPDSIL